MSIRVLIADDQAMVRGGLRLMLDRELDIEVIAEAADGAEAVALARSLKPDVCLIDVQMPKLNGIDVTRALAARTPEPLRVVIVTTFDDDEYVEDAIEAGALGFILKDSGPTLLAEAVRAAHGGEALVSPSITLRLLRRSAVRFPGNDQVAHGLTAREVDVVRAVARGRTNEEIGQDLYISLSTVKSHIRSIQEKLGVRNRVGIAMWAWRNRLIT